MNDLLAFFDKLPDKKRRAIMEVIEVIIKQPMSPTDAILRKAFEEAGVSLA